MQFSAAVLGQLSFLCRCLWYTIGTNILNEIDFHPVLILYRVFLIFNVAIKNIADLREQLFVASHAVL